MAIQMLHRYPSRYSDGGDAVAAERRAGWRARTGAVVTVVIGFAAGVWLITGSAARPVALGSQPSVIPMVLCAGLVAVGIVVQLLKRVGWSALATALTFVGVVGTIVFCR